MEYYLGAENCTGYKTTDESKFLAYIQNLIADAKAAGVESLELTVENGWPNPSL